jgi:hypothetical protein
MKTRWLAFGVGLGVLVTLTLGFAWGVPSMMGGTAGPGSGMLEAMEAMHDSPQMRVMHEQMPEDLQARCDALHEQMVASGYAGMMGPGWDTVTGGMMGSGGTMGNGWGPGGMMGT